MTPRERFLASCRFQPVDRIPYRELAVYGQAIDRWETEGLPGNAIRGYTPSPAGEALPQDDFCQDDFYHGSQYFGFDRWDFVNVNLGICPPYDTVILEEDERTVLYTDGLGVKHLTMKEGVSHGHTPCMDQYIEFPVKNRQDFERLKPRFSPHSPERYPGSWEKLVQCHKHRDYPLAMPESGAFGFFSRLRRWMGTEAACLVFYDDPALAHAILDFQTDFVIETIHKALDDLDFEYYEIWEDFAFKGQPFISPELFEEFLAPYYRRLIGFVRSHGVEFVSLDSDGKFDVLIPQLIEVGVNVIWPVEVASGMDALDLRGKFGRDMILWGGIDKREIAKGREAIDREVYRQVPRLIEYGGYIPHLDGGWPQSISYDNFRYFIELKARVAEGRDGA
jgi:uroporphyrinogen decarboxylase